MMVSLRKKSFDLRSDEPAEGDGCSSDSDSEESPKFYRHRKLTLDKMKSKRCIKEGFLNMKQKPGSFQRWKKYYFRLQEKKKLCYAKDPTLFGAVLAAGTACKNNDVNEQEIFTEVDIQDSSVAETSIKNVNNSFSIIMPFLTLILCGDNRREMEEWISALRNATLRNSNSDILDRLSDGHNWYSRSHSRPTVCNVCDELLPGVTSRGLSCEVCTYTVHKRCAVRAADKCKWTTLETIPTQDRLSEYNDPFAMTHQWMQLNILSGSKCLVCDKACGGKKNPQDMKCLWCGLTVHSSCENHNTTRGKCSLGGNHLSILPPTAISFSSKQGMPMEATRPPNGNPLLVFVNTRSGDNQGVKFIRKFKQLLNPAQVFDLSFGGPAQGLKLFQNLDLFRILICGGDGSVGWVMTEIDRMNLMKKCQISVLPLGTGNDLSRVLRWGASFYDATALPFLLKWLEGAKTEMLDRWSIMIQEERDMSESRSTSCYSLSNASENKTGSEPSINTIEHDIGKHLTRIMYSNENTEVISSARVLCGIVKDLVSKVGSVSASEEPSTSGETDSLSQKCRVLNDKLDQLLHTLNVEAEAGQQTAGAGQVTASVKPKVFVPRDALMSRANSLKKALRQIIDHTEKAVDEQNSQTASNTGLAQTIVSAAATAVSEVSAPTVTTHDIRGDKQKSLSDIPEATSDSGGYPPYSERYSPRLLSRSSPQRSESALDELKSVESKATVHFPGTIIAKAFLKEKLSDSYGSVSGMVCKALMANVDTLCAAATPVLDSFVSVDGFTERCVMNNYLGVGIDAKIVLDFHLKREENPDQFRSRKLNLIHYGVLGGKELLQSSYKNLDQRVQVEVDGHKLHLPRLQGIVVLNIPSYMSGSNFWGSWKDDDGFTTPSFDDNIIEVVAIFSCSQMGMAKVFGGMPYHRMAQCRSVKITITEEAVPVQVDGEPWMQPPGVIKIVHKNRAQMLVRDAEFESTLKSWTDIQQEKQEKHCMSEEENMKQMVFSLTALIKCIQMSVVHTIILERLLPMAENLETKLNLVFPAGKLAESASRFDLSELVSMGKFFEENVKEFMDTKVDDLSPAMSTELRDKINDAAVKARESIRNVIEIHGLGSVSDESDKGSVSRGKGVFGLGRLRLSKRPEMPKANTAPAGRMIQFWRVSEVCEWLKSIGLAEYKEVFALHEIGGDRLLHLDKDQLKNIGVHKQEHRKKILRSIKSLCGGLSPSSALLIDRTEHGSRQKARQSLDIEKDFDSQ